MLRAHAKVAAANFRIDLKTVEVSRALVAREVEHLYLKGRTFAELLYSEPGERPYGDIDLLVPPTSLDEAMSVLSHLGFRPFEPWSISSTSDPALGEAVGVTGAVHASAWLRPSDYAAVDLHTSLPQVFVDDTVVWETLRHYTTTLQIVDRPTPALNRTASALLVALHAAHNGPRYPKSMQDLARALRLLPRETWEEAMDLASRLRAERPMGAGLGLDPRGAQIAVDLGLSPHPSAGLLMHWDGAPWSACVIEALASPPYGARSTLLRHLIHARAGSHGAAQGSHHGRRARLAGVGIHRLFRIALRTPSALLDWRRRRSRSRDRAKSLIP